MNLALIAITPALLAIGSRGQSPPHLCSDQTGLALLALAAFLIGGGRA